MRTISIFLHTLQEQFESLHLTGNFCL